MTLHGINRDQRANRHVNTFSISIISHAKHWTFSWQTYYNKKSRSVIIYINTFHLDVQVPQLLAEHSLQHSCCTAYDLWRTKNKLYPPRRTVSTLKLGVVLCVAHILNHLTGVSVNCFHLRLSTITKYP